MSNKFFSPEVHALSTRLAETRERITAAVLEHEEAADGYITTARTATGDTLSAAWKRREDARVKLDSLNGQAQILAGDLTAQLRAASKSAVKRAGQVDRQHGQEQAEAARPHIVTALEAVELAINAHAAPSRDGLTALQSEATQLSAPLGTAGRHLVPAPAVPWISGPSPALFEARRLLRWLLDL